MLRDGHIHSPFCPHGTKDSFDDYIEKAIELGFVEMSFTEHAPLPAGFIDPTPMHDSAMTSEDLFVYLDCVREVKHRYRHRMKINVGLEVDYIEGYEEETTKFLNEVGPMLDDAILSVHFLKHKKDYFCLDYSPEVFEQMIITFGSIESLYKAYYDTLLKSITTNLGAYKPKRIGHMTLVHKFQKKFPVQTNFKVEIETILNTVKTGGYELDYNGAGTAKPLCREPYPPNWIIERAKTLGIHLVYGSDAHQVKDLGQGLPSMVF